MTTHMRILLGLMIHFEIAADFSIYCWDLSKHVDPIMMLSLCATFQRLSTVEIVWRRHGFGSISVDIVIHRVSMFRYTRLDAISVLRCVTLKWMIQKSWRYADEGQKKNSAPDIKAKRIFHPGCTTPFSSAWLKTECWQDSTTHFYFFIYPFFGQNRSLLNGALRAVVTIPTRRPVICGPQLK